MELRDFFVVLIVLGVACFEAEAQQNCGTIPHPAHGQVFVQGYKRGDKARFTCDTGYVLHGAEEVQCFGNNMWSGMPPICINPKNIDDIVHSMTSVAEIERRQIERRRSWRYGLDVVMIMDTSSNIGPEYHEASKSCMKLLVDIFSNDGSGGVFLILFILTDGNSIQQEDVKLKSFIHEIYGLEVFVLGVGQNINEKALRLIASKPVKKHVFFINEFTNIEAVERYSDWMKIAVPLNAMKEAANRFTVTRYDSHAMRNVVLMVDVSSNISPEYLTAAKYFMKQIVDIFGVVVGISSRFGLVTFADTATVILNVYVDAETLLGEVIKQKIDGVQNTVGGSNLTTAFDLFLQDMYLPVTRFGSESYDIYRLDRKWNIFVFTDGEGITKDDNVRLSSTFKDLLGPGVEIFAMGIGQSINIEAMRSIASKPADKHVFEINAFRNLTKIDGAVLKGKCLVKRGRHCGCNKRDFRVC
ncbi:uncharacterized protein LOC127838013 isoform X3 [Dreissena polymorpha]|uniref:uncharacterized protein LOC127838013 isoform X3 n=1 Tax=Dreissena polymorpha TaxID=45954 RepID=UPI0022650F5B|nr:uncharacterized protein LOC127838013 isoform X3 [Dreissena polymorpha]